MFIQIAQVMFCLMLLVMLHELGHFVAARWFGVRVERFFCFFDVKFALWKKKIGDTIYGIGWLPLGGYVKLSGMIDESMDTEQMKQEPKPWEFRTKPAWQRLIIMLGGIIVNIVLAMIIYTALFYKNGESYIDVNKLNYGIEVDSIQTKYGLKRGDIPVGVDDVRYNSLGEIMKESLLNGKKLTVKRGGQEISLPIDKDFRSDILKYKQGFFLPAIPTIVDSVFKDSPAEKSGLEKGDKIVAIDGLTTKTFSDFKETLDRYKDQKIAVSIIRSNEPIELSIDVDKEGKIGFSSYNFDYAKNHYESRKEFSFIESLYMGLKEPFNSIMTQLRGISTLFKVKDGLKQVSGPIGMVDQMPKTWNWNFVWNFTAIISAWLAFINLVPIPGLDGGHALFTIYEMVTRKKPSDKFMEKAQTIGFFILIGLMIFTFGNDIFNKVSKYF